MNMEGKALKDILSLYDIFQPSGKEVLQYMETLKVGDEDPLVLFAWNTVNSELFRAEATAVAHLLPRDIDCTSATAFYTSLVKFVSHGTGIHVDDIYTCAGFCCSPSQFGSACHFLGRIESFPWLQAILKNYNGGAIARIMINKQYSKIHEMVGIEMPGSRLWAGPGPNM